MARALSSNRSAATRTVASHRTRATGRMGQAASAPGVPTGLAAVFISSTEIDVGWRPADGSQTGFLLQRAPDSSGSPGTWATIAPAIASSATTYQDTGLTASTTYWYKIQAFNATGSSAFSSAISATTLSSVTAPGTPTGTTATGVSSTQINVSWSAGSGGTPTSYTLQRSASGAGIWSTIYTGSTASFQDTGRSASTTYDYRVSATNSAGTSSNSSTFSGITLASGTLSLPTIPNPLTSIGVVQSAFSSTPVNSYMDSLSNGTPVAGYTRSVGFVFGSTSAVSTADHIHGLDATIVFAAYTNITNVYGGTMTAPDILENLLAYFDANGFDRETAFIHTAAARAFSGGSGSARPCRWFWGIGRFDGSNSLLNNYSQTTSTPVAVTFGASSNHFLAVGNLDRFRQIDATITTAAASGYTYALEYPTAKDGSNNPTAWSTLSTLADGTSGLTVSGSITWNPPTDWIACALGGSSACYFWVRFRCTGTGTTPIASALRSYDYLSAVDSASAGTIPAFDSTVDGGSKGWLTAAEYATRAAGKDAYFKHQSRFVMNTYGAQRYATYPSSQLTTWAQSYYTALLDNNTRFIALFLDNNSLHANNVGSGASTVESLTNFQVDWKNCLTAVWNTLNASNTRFLWPHAYFGQANETTGEGCIQACRASWNESRLKPVKEDWTTTDDTLTTYARCLALSPSPQFVGIDANFIPIYGNEDRSTDRTYLAALAEFLQIHSPGVTWLSITGGDAGQSWQQTWRDAYAFNFGSPSGASTTTTGNDPAKPSAAPAATPSASGGTIADGTYYFKVSYGKTSSGACETLPNTTEGTFTVSGGGGAGSVSIASPSADGLTPGYMVYVGSVSGGPYYRQGTFTAIGSPTVLTSLTLSGTTPQTTGQTYKIYQRTFAHCIAYYRPISHTISKPQGTLCDSSAVSVTLPQVMQPLNADGTKGTAVSSFTLRAGEGKIYCF